jgi:hypothetical protein
MLANDAEKHENKTICTVVRKSNPHPKIANMSLALLNVTEMNKI